MTPAQKTPLTQAPWSVPRSAVDRAKVLRDAVLCLSGMATLKSLQGTFLVGCPVRREVVQYKVQVMHGGRGIDLESTIERLPWQLYQLAFGELLLSADSLADLLARELVAAGLAGHVKVRVKSPSGDTIESEFKENHLKPQITPEGAQLSMVTFGPNK